MRRLVIILFTSFFGSAMAMGQSINPAKVVWSTKVDESPVLRDVARPIEKSRGATRNRDARDQFRDARRRHGSSEVDAVWQNQQGEKPAAAVKKSWEALTNADNPSRTTPPDPSIDVGPNHVVQMVNKVFAIWDKNGNRLVGPSSLNSLWTGFGGDCEFNNDVDPVVVYDPLADRWLLTQPVILQKLCVAVSKTGDPTGQFYRYEFNAPGNDYTKFGVWSNAYVASIRNFSGQFNMDAAAFERSRMLSGLPARMVLFDIWSLLPSIDGVLPADVDGAAPPPGRQPTFMGFQAENDRLALFELNVDWANIGNSQLIGPSFLPVAPIDPAIDGISQPQTNNRLDAIAIYTMFRLAYRNFGGYEALVANHTVDVNDFNDHAGVRWYELRRSGAGDWSLFQQGTYAPDGDSRWMGSIAMDKNGSIMAAYSVASSATFPSIRFAGRNAGDPLGQFTIQEGTLVDGKGSQTGSGRWGDYSSLVVDPADDQTFWYTNEYYPFTSATSWVTNISAFTAAPPDVVVSCDPVNPPVIIPTPGGGPLDYRLTVTNNSTSARTVDVWAYAQRNGFGKTDARFLQQGVFLSPGASRVFNNQDLIPTVDPGNFTYNCKAGSFAAGQIISSSSFPWSVSVNVSPGIAGVRTPEGSEAGWEAVARAGERRGNPALSEESTAIPEQVTLHANYPNPFNPSTTISFTLPTERKVRITIFDVRGRTVRDLFDGKKSAGRNTAQWNGRDNAGGIVASGVYFYRLQSGALTLTGKMLLAK